MERNFSVRALISQIIDLETAGSGASTLHFQSRFSRERRVPRKNLLLRFRFGFSGRVASNQLADRLRRLLFLRRAVLIFLFLSPRVNVSRDINFPRACAVQSSLSPFKELSLRTRPRGTPAKDAGSFVPSTCSPTWKNICLFPRCHFTCFHRHALA